MRQSMWMIHNANEIQGVHERNVVLNGESIDLFFANYVNAKEVSELFQFWIEDRIVSPGTWIASRDPVPMRCGFVATKTKITESSQDYINNVISLCLRLVLHPPIFISHPGHHVDAGAIVNPAWDNMPSQYRVSNTNIDEKTIDKIIELILRFGEKEKTKYPYFHEILRLASIDDVLIETLGLWAFIEGFWNPAQGDSDLSESFLNLLTTDRFPGSRKKDSRVQILKRKIMDQNHILGANTFSELRNIVAHGTYLELEDKWSRQQWDAIYAQRDLLLDIVLTALVERNLRNA